MFSTPVVNGNGHVARGNGDVTSGDGAVATSDSRGRSATVPIDSNERDRTEGEEDDEVFYINVAGMGEQDLYQNVTHLN